MIVKRVFLAIGAIVLSVHCALAACETKDVIFADAFKDTMGGWTQGAGIKTVDARFVGVPSVTLSEPTEFKISSTLEVLEKPLLTDDEYFIATLPSEAEFLVYEDLFNQVVNIDLPETLG